MKELRGWYGFHMIHWQSDDGAEQLAERTTAETNVDDESGTNFQGWFKVPQRRTAASECLEVVSASLATRDRLPPELRTPHERAHLGLCAGWGSTTGDRPCYQV